ncbi:helix-turn-helix domain-containing protein [Thermolongibacillus altinsuensis]|uniref:helix-turn-helix domain-containing protein n=1 Tax=Thermolongibacillus altinsuensis TaxID=575256 RepID=UPI00242A2DDC|nr:helix-turn-helix domain-containing protein [Thermolongibacillus altinsuensis]GMB07831.1 ATP-dependent DNA helicase RecQ [Thermolongibacillus altinsuensis]
MMPSYLAKVVLFCLSRLNGERSLAAIYHLLNGKKSAQTLQDSKWYHLDFLFGTLAVQKSEILYIANRLEHERLIERIDDDTYKVTEKGEAALAQFSFPAYLNGLRYVNETEAFWRRLSLLVQTISNLVHETTFEPIQRDEETLLFVKRWLLSRRNVTALAQSLYEELHRLLSRLDEKEANVFVWRLTSYERIGLTNEQVALALQEDPAYTQLLFQHVLHFFLKTTEKESHRFPLLFSLRADLYETIPLTSSTKKTYELLQQGRTLDEIARIRRLKRSTIEDHIVEIAANIPHFSIAPFLSEEKRQQIVGVAEKLRTKKLRMIKEALEDVSYFQIRLALAKRGDGDGDR